MYKTFLLTLLLPAVALAQPQQDTLNGKEDMPQVTIVGYKDRLLAKVPGSVSVLKFKDIQTLQPISGNDIVRRVPGINITDEEGAGLRINIGIRGLDPDRSRSVLMLEDGIPVALNPYGEPEMYFTPVIDKVRSIEVLKGSGQVLFGPQTIGGVVNFITANPPDSATTEVRLRGGENGFFSGYASYGNTVGNTGFIVSFLRKQANNMGPTWFHINDLSAKLKIRLNDKSSIGFKLGLYDELSNSTYIGITTPMWLKAGADDFVRIAPHDRLPVRRYNISATHNYRFTNNIQLQTTAFAYSISRNWQRQDFSYSRTAANQTGVVWGDPTISNGAIFMLNSNGHRNRQFEVMGVEPRLTIKGKLGNGEHQLKLGARALYEKANEQFVIGAKADATAGNIRDNEIRSGLALSAFVQEEWQLNKKLRLNAGVRAEQFDYSRRILRGRFTVNSVSNVVRDTNVLASRNIVALIPGAGFSYEASEQFTFFGGVHKGYAPPRTKDAITPTGVTLDLDAENSWNYELGTRFAIGNIISGELTAFMMDFQNQIIPTSVSSGNANATGLANGGATRHKGVELGVQWDISKTLGMKKWAVLLNNNLTYVNSRYNEDRFLNKGTELVNVAGNKLPYAPEWIWNGTLAIESKQGLGMRLFSNYVAEQFADELNTVEASANGRTGLLDSRLLIDATAFYTLPNKKISFNISAKNLSNERYIASRRPEGIRVGIGRMVTAGVDIVL